MLRLLLFFLSDPCRHPVEFAARVFEPVLGLFLLLPIHVRQGFGEPLAGATQDGHRQFQFAFQSDCGWFRHRRLPLCFQK